MKTKIVLITVAFSFLLSTFNCSSQSWIWAKSAGSTYIDNSFKSSVNKATGDVYVTGQFSSPYAIFESETLNCNGFTDIYYGKYDANGNLLWAKRTGGALGGQWPDGTGEYGSEIFYDSLTNTVYLTGVFNGTMILGSDTLASSSRDIFLVKLDIDGNVIWAKKAGGTADDVSYALSLDNSGNIYLTGRINSITALFDSFSVNKGGFLAKYDNNGNCIFAKRISQMTSPPNEDCRIYSINYFNNNLYLIGNTQKTTITLDTISATSVIGSVIISCFNLNGNVLWIKLTGGQTGDIIVSGMDNVGNIYITGGYSDSIKFDNFILHTVSNYADMFLAKCNVSGNFIWANDLNMPANSGVIISDLTTNNNGNIYTTGYWWGTANFGNFNVTSQTGNDMYVARYDSAGTCLGVRNFGQAWGNSVVNDNTGSLIVTGIFNNTVNIGATPLTSRGQTDVYIAKHANFTGIEDKRMPVASNNNLIIYANPNTGKCNITVPDDFLNEPNLTLSIFDNSGKLIQQKSLEMVEGKIKLDIENEAKGIYNAVLGNGKKSYFGKIIFE